MKIAVVAGSAPPLSQGGVATAHYNLFRFLRAAGYDAKLFTHEDIGEAPREHDIVRAGPRRSATVIARRAAGAAFRMLEPGTNPYHVADILYSLTSARALRRNVAAYDPDVLIVPDRGVPLLWIDPPARCRVIQIEHHNPARFTEQLPGDPPPSRRDIAAAVWLGQRALGKVSVVVCPARYMLDEFERTFSFGGPREVIPHVADEQAFKGVEPHATFPQAIYIPSGGSIVKGEPYVAQLVAKLVAARPDLGFFISGTVQGNLRDALARVTDRVVAPGPLPWRENLALAASCRVCMSPALAENFSMAILEALWLGVPVATFDVGGNRDLVDDSCGAIVPPNDVDALAAATLRILDRKDLRPKQRALAIQSTARQAWLDLLGPA